MSPCPCGVGVAGAAKFAEIPSSKYAMLDDMLAKKEGRA